MTTSPTLTSSGTRLPLSSTRPGPTAMTVPSCGFSLAVSGMTRPEAVVVSASFAWTTTRSSRGLMLTLVALVTSGRPLRDRTADVVLMLRRGCRAPAVAGVRLQPVSVGTLPTRVPATQPGPLPGGQAVREAVRRDLPRRPGDGAAQAAHRGGSGGDRPRVHAP